MSNENIMYYLISECLATEEDITSHQAILSETMVTGRDGNKIPIVTTKTCAQSFDVKNWNERIYGENTVMNGINNDKNIQYDMRRGAIVEFKDGNKTYKGYKGSNWMSESGHPTAGDPGRQCVALPEKQCGRILNYWVEEHDGIRKLMVIYRTTPGNLGPDVAVNTLDGIPLALSMRGSGAIDMMTRRVKDPLKVYYYDQVNRPSHKEAYTHSMLTEGGVHVPVKGASLSDVLAESTHLAPITDVEFNRLTEQVEDYIKEKSNNIQTVKDLFEVDVFQEATLSPDGDRYIIQVNESAKISMPVEKVLVRNYHDLLSSSKVNFTRK